MMKTFKNIFPLLYLSSLFFPFSLSCSLFPNRSSGAGRTSFPSREKRSWQRTGRLSRRKGKLREKRFLERKPPFHAVNTHRQSPYLASPYIHPPSPFRFLSLVPTLLSPPPCPSPSICPPPFSPSQGCDQTAALFCCSITNCSCKRCCWGLEHFSCCYATQSLTTTCKLPN